MAKYTDAKCRLCRREGVKLFLKGARCYSPKCPIEKRGGQIPGQHGKKQGRPRLSGYGIQLREKQKAKRFYGILETQFHRYYEEAIKSRQNTGEVLMRLLETRLDNLVYRLGLTLSRSLARQLVTHGNVLVDGKKIDVPSYSVKPGQVIAVSPRGAKINFVTEAQKIENIALPSWLSRKAIIGKLERFPSRDEIGSEIKENLIIEFYSR
ncbi:30S ribosomal protein S4 [Candidatus Collierbacteria bacterium]|nr:30S ribosomal protein S4 [Candidatus Collierbacteria bacterium]